jgi:hypothetical protein
MDGAPNFQALDGVMLGIAVATRGSTVGSNWRSKSRRLGSFREAGWMG